MYGYNKINSFAEVDAHSVTSQLSDQIKKKIEQKGKDYILGVDEDEFKNYLISEYTLEPLKIFYDQASIDEPKKSKEFVENRMWGERYETEVYKFDIKYPFSGSAVIFKIRPSTFTLTSTEIYVDESSSIVSFSFQLIKKDPEEFKKLKSDYERRAFSNLTNANNEAESWNSQLPSIVNQHFSRVKNELLQENDFFTAINVKVNENTKSVFTPPTVKKKVIPQPKIPDKTEFSSEPTMNSKMYDDILKVIYDSGKNMEKKPVLYKAKDEEGLRDQFLFVLETRYEGTTATGETFNRKGKTDILLKYAKDASNLFVAECKFWHGASEFQKAISQLFDRYLTWRDSKAALILFVTNKDFSNVLETIQLEAPKHDYYVRSNGNRGESSFSYVFRLPQDAKKDVYLEILAFHFDEK